MAKFLFVVFLMLPSIAWGSEAHCPHANSGAALTTVTLYDGPPAEHADLMADHYQKTGKGGHQEWSVAYIFDNGRSLYIECIYGPEDKSILLKPERVEACVFSSDNGIKALDCR